MFEQVFDNLRKATEASMQMQQEMFQKWVSLWPAGMTVPQSPWSAQVQDIQRKWTEIINDMLTKQRQLLQTQFEAGLKHIEEAFKVAQAKDAKELQTKTVEFWQKSFDCLRQTYETQMKEFQAAMQKWTEAVTRP